jgi:hypothetical protein
MKKKLVNYIYAYINTEMMAINSFLFSHVVLNPNSVCNKGVIEFNCNQQTPSMSHMI